MSGSPYEMGYQQGVLLGDAIRARIGNGLLGGIVQQGQVSHFLLLRHARQTDSRIRPEHRAEMVGVADGAGVSYSDVLVLNTYDDLVARPWPEESTQDLLLSLSPAFTPHFGPPGAPGGPGQDARGGTSGPVPSSRALGAFAVFGLATRDGSLLQVVEFGSPTPHPEELVMRVYQPEEGDSFVCVGPPGAVGCEVGLNEEQISVTALFSPSGDSSLDEVPLPFILRDVLQYAGDIPGALTILASGERTTGHNVILGDGKRPDAQVVEFSQHLYAVFEGQNDFVVRTNHFLDESLAETQRSLSWWQEDESWEHLEELLKGLESDYGRLDSAG
ncbi:MAG: C45 family peptidase, partial [Anaerolineae bacterium]|nr:C45 family peptidase [Anaerolineae bacterium]